MIMKECGPGGAPPLDPPMIVMLGNQFPSVTMYSNGDAAADVRCGQKLTFQIYQTLILHIHKDWNHVLKISKAKG